MTKTGSARRRAAAGLIGAAYLALCAAFPALSFGQIQVRFAEVFTLLPLFTPAGIWGVTIGCALSNIYGLALGTNIIGIWDIFRVQVLLLWLRYSPISSGIFSSGACRFSRR